MSINLHDVLLRDFSSMLKDSNDHDAIIKVGGNRNMKEFLAHSSILKARSNYFRRALSIEWITKRDNKIEFKKPNIDPAVFEIILNYIYKGEIELMDQSGEFIFELLIATDELLLEELFYKLQDYLIKKQSNWIQDNLIFVLNTVFTLPNCNVVQDYCMEILKDPKFFMESEDFPLLRKNILCELLKRDDFLGDETIVWDCSIKWSIEKTPSLRSNNRDRSKWYNDDYEALKETFDQFIPFIRFSEISSADFFDKVRPFKAIIPNNIYEEFMEFHMKGTLPVNSAISSPRIAKLDIESKIIKPVHAYVIANWIEGKDAKAIRNKNDLRYKFNLLYSGRNDGFDVRKFRSKCMNKGPCLILIKPSPNNLTQSTSENNLDTCNTQSVLSPDAQNLAKIYGEYYSGILTKDVWECTTENFIFSFANDADIKNMKICRMNYNILLDKSGGDFDPTNTFRMKGQNISVNNLAYNDNNVINSNMSKFVPMEIEVFKTTSDI